MDNQHKKIKGYRDLSQVEIDLMNEGKELAEQVGAWIVKLETVGPKAEDDTRSFDWSVEPDSGWLQDAKITLQKGFMSAIRSIAKPETF